MTVWFMCKEILLMKTFLSVVIPARHSQDTIRVTLDSLARQTRLPDEVIIVVGADDPTGTTIQDYLASGFARILEMEIPQSLVRDTQWKRRFGAQQAKGEVIFFTDSKIIVEEHALERTLALMDEYKVEAVAGVSPGWAEQKDHFLAKVQDLGLVIPVPNFGSNQLLHRENFGQTENLPVGPAFAMTKRAFDLIQADFGLEFTRVAASYDDYVMAWLLVDKGITILTTGSVIAYHKHRLTWGGITTQMARSGQSAGNLTFFYPTCPLAYRRRTQIWTIVGLAAVGLVSLPTMLVFFGLTSLFWLGLAGISSLLLLGITNAIKARSWWGLLIPPVTVMLILTFVSHYIKAISRKGSIEEHEFKLYLQIH
jgi:cellulose synthase/poly-beta-1,6-N-acetylglucosamine synthase-like glycosyltransferase